MQCPNCGTETKGIKINRKLFCTNCGVKIGIQEIPQNKQKQRIVNNEELNNQPVVPKIQNPKQFSEPKAKIITQSGEEITNSPLEEAEEKVLGKIEIAAGKKEIDTLTAEEKILGLLEKKAMNKTQKKTKNTLGNKTIKKHNRPRVERHKKNDFVILPGEPNPIETPELKYPEKDQIEPPKEKLAEADESEIKINFLKPESEIKYPLLEKERIAEINKKAKVRQKIVTNFLKETAPKKQTRKKKKSHKKLWFASIIIIIVTLVAVGMVLYVNLYATRPERANETLNLAQFNYKVPTYIPPGYEISYKTTAGPDFANLVYEYKPDETKALEIKITETELNAGSLFKEKIEPQAKSYELISENEVDFYFVEQNSAYFINNNLLYEITSSDGLGKEELQKIAEGLI